MSSASSKKFHFSFVSVLPALLTALISAVLLGFVFLDLLGFHQDSKRVRDEAEIAAMSAALEAYHADNGRYPSSLATRSLRPEAGFPPGNYIAASKTLYQALSASGDKVYFEFSKNMIKQDASGETYIVDPHGNAYGYSTTKVRNGINSYDLWTIRGNPHSTNQWYGSW